MNPAIDQSSQTEIVTDEKKLHCEDPKYEPGGGGINVSRALHILEGSSLALFPAGGMTGNLLQYLLNQEQLQYKVISIQDTTRINMSILESSTGKQYRFNMPGAHLTEEEQRHCLDTIEEAITDAEYLVASGSLPPGVSDEYYGKIAALAKKCECRFIADTSGNALRKVLDQGVYLIKPNLREFTDIIGKDIESEEQIIADAKDLVQRNNIDVLVLSLGAAGVLMVSEEEQYHFYSPITPIKSRVGAGDSMLAGMTLRLSQGADNKEAVQYGIAAGAAAVMTPGTELCRKEDTDRLFQTIVEHQCN
jgi:6-phosphofructokinase 2